VITQVDPYWTYVAILMIASLGVITYLMVKSAKQFPPERVEETAHEFAGVIKDSHGPVTYFLWATYMGLLVWAVAYLIQHSHEFLELGY
jgi:Na+/serine symporter